MDDKDESDSSDDDSYDQLPDNCEICGKTEHEDKLLICDNCNHGWHTYCVGLEGVPEEEHWFCPTCEITRMDEFDNGKSAHAKRTAEAA